MPIYNYVAIDKEGKEIKDSIELLNKELVISQLKAEELLVVSVTEVNALNKDINFTFLNKRPSARDLAVFCRQFVSIVEAGVPVIAALEMLSEQTQNKILADAVGECRISIQEGNSLTESMKKHPKAFPDLLVTMVAAGEATGSLEISFGRMAEHFEKDAKLRSSVKKASIYPAAIVVVASIVVALMLAFVIPQFEELLSDMGIDLPWVTQMVMDASLFMQTYWYIVLIGAVVIIYGLRAFSKTLPGKRMFGKILIKLPLFGTLTVKTASARMSRTLATLIAAGIPLTEALDIVAETMDNIYFSDALLRAKEDVMMGMLLSEPLIKSELFPPMVCHMVKIGEESGDVEKMLSKLADYYEEEVEAAVQALMAALEPLIIVVLAIIIGTIVMAVILPMGEMYSGIDNL